MNVTDVMIDIETLGLNNTAPVVQIGAVAFNRYTGDRVTEFFSRINLQDALNKGDIEGDTLVWWLRQSEAARESLAGGPTEFTAEAVSRLSDFYMRAVAASRDEDLPVWACGPVFDIGKLERLFELCDEQIPWAFYAIRDTRTIEDLSPVNRQQALALIGWDRSKETAHDALSDCRYQVAYLTPMINSLVGDEQVYA